MVASRDGRSVSAPGWMGPGHPCFFLSLKTRGADLYSGERERVPGWSTKVAGAQIAWQARREADNLGGGGRRDSRKVDDLRAPRNWALVFRSDLGP